MTDEAIADSGIDMEAATAEMGDMFPSAEEPEIEAEAAPEIEPEKPAEETPEIRTAPQSWKKEMHEAWTALTPEMQDQIELRETQMKEGLEKDRGDANLGKIMRDTMAPYSDLLKQQNVDEPTMIRNMMNAHYKLSTASPEEKTQLFNQLAESYGINPTGETTQVDPVIKQLQDELNGIKSNLNQKDQATLQEARTRVESEVEAFASEHPMFDELSDDMLPYLNAGFSLTDAYEKATWANPVTRQKEQQRITEEGEKAALEKANEKVAKAKKASSTNVRSRDTSTAPTEPTGTMEDTMHETLREIKNR